MPPHEATPEEYQQIVKKDLAETASHEAGHAIASVIHECGRISVHLFRNSKLISGDQIEPINKDRLFLGSTSHTAPPTDMGKAIIGYAGVLAEWLHNGKLEGLSDDDIFQMTEKQNAMSESDKKMVAAIGAGKHEAFDKALLLVRTYRGAIAALTNYLTNVFMHEGGRDSVIPIPNFVPPKSSTSSSQ